LVAASRNEIVRLMSDAIKRKLRLGQETNQLVFQIRKKELVADVTLKHYQGIQMNYGL
jgi:hypothetical protein